MFFSGFSYWKARRKGKKGLHDLDKMAACNPWFMFFFLRIVGPCFLAQIKDAARNITGHNITATTSGIPGNSSSKPFTNVNDSRPSRFHASVFTKKVILNELYYYISCDLGTSHYVLFNLYHINFWSA